MTDLRTRLLAKRTVTAVPIGDDTEAYVRVMTVNELVEVQARCRDEDLSEIDAAAWMACKTVCDADGNRLFQDGDYPLVKTMDLQVLVALANAAAEANSPAKKKPSPPTSGSSTGSPSTSESTRT